MNKLNQHQKKNYEGGAAWKYSKTMNVAFGIATVSAAINTIFDIVNTSIYLNGNSQHNQPNPYNNHGARIKYGSDIRHSGIFLF